MSSCASLSLTPGCLGSIMPSGLEPIVATPGLDRSGWTMCSVLVMSPPLKTAASPAGVFTTATTGRMFQLSVTVSVILYVHLSLDNRVS